jgi:glycosyltransferase involved in cell wall biosynthesis
MRVILANKYWYLKGGAERYTFELAKLLERHGDRVVPFAMRDPRNAPSKWSRQFVSPVETARLRYGWQGLRTAGRMLWSFEAAGKFRTLVRETRPDVLHAQNLYHQISPSVLAEARKLGLPAVMTLHDYHLISPNYGMFAGGRVVEPWKAHPYLDTFARRLIGGSWPASALSAFEGWLHERLRVYGKVAKFIAPSEFLKRKCVEYGVAEERIEVVPHFIDLAGKRVHDASERRVAAVGRLSPEKGLDTLVRAAKSVPDVRVVIVGDGPDRGRLEALAKELGAGNVEFMGALHGEALEREIGRARALVIPSLSYEVFGLTALEAYALGKPVIASRIGGLPEVVRDGGTGLLFRPGDPHDLAAKIERLCAEESRARDLGRAGRRLAETDYAPGKHYDRIHAIYEEVMTRR